MKIEISNRALEGICKGDIVSGYYCVPRGFLIGNDSFSILNFEDKKKAPGIYSARGYCGGGSTGEAASKTPD